MSAVNLSIISWFKIPLWLQNKCIINERYIPEHQNKLNIYDYQNYDFFAIFFQPKKNRKIVKFQKWKKFVKFEFSIYATCQLYRQMTNSIIKYIGYFATLELGSVAAQHQVAQVKLNLAGKQIICMLTYAVALTLVVSAGQSRLIFFLQFVKYLST